MCIYTYTAAALQGPDWGEVKEVPWLLPFKGQIETALKDAHKTEKAIKSAIQGRLGLHVAMFHC